MQPSLKAMLCVNSTGHWECPQGVLTGCILRPYLPCRKTLQCNFGKPSSGILIRVQEVALISLCTHHTQTLVDQLGMLEVLGRTWEAVVVHTFNSSTWEAGQQEDF